MDASPSEDALPSRIAALAPGLGLALAVAGAAAAGDAAQAALGGRAVLDAVVLALLGGVALRTAGIAWPALRPGLAFASATLLEIGVALLGASLSLGLILAVGPALVAAVAAVVAAAFGASWAIGRALRLPGRTAILVASGNAICGNSAIMAVAPAIGASAAEVAASVAVTATLGVAVVLLLPALVPLLGLSESQYGAVAGLTVYAVPQVVAATAPVGPLATQVGAFVKLLRVLTLGPLLLALALAARRRAPEAASGPRPGLLRLVPAFVLAFLALMALRSLDAIPAPLLGPMATASKALTIVAMAALGLGVDVRTVAKAGGRTSLAVALSLLAILALSLGVVALGIVR